MLVVKCYLNAEYQHETPILVDEKQAKQKEPEMVQPSVTKLRSNGIGGARQHAADITLGFQSV